MWTSARGSKLLQRHAEKRHLHFHTMVISCVSRNGANKQGGHWRAVDYLSVITPKMGKTLGGSRHLAMSALGQKQPLG